MKLSYDQKMKLYRKLALVKKHNGPIIYQSMPCDGVWLGETFYSLKDIVNAINNKHGLKLEV